MLNLRTSLLALVLAGALTGCAVSDPPAHQELVSEALNHAVVPDHWQNGIQPGQFDADTLGFPLDAQLKALIAEAWKYNADLRIAGARVEQARAALKAAGGPLLPSVSLAAQSGNSALPTSTLSTTGVGIVASWEIDLWGRLRSERSARAEQLQASELDTLYSKQAIAAEVVRSWLAIVEANQQVDLAKSMLAGAEQQLNLIRIAEKVGRNTAQDLALNEAAVEVYRNQLQANEQVRSQAQRALEVLLGRYPSAEVTAASRLPETTSALPSAGIPSELMSRRPDVLAAEQRFRAAFHNVEAAKRARLPSLRLTGGVAYIEDSTVMLKSGIENPLWAVTGKMLAPIFTGGQLAAQVEAQNSVQQEAIAHYSKAALNALAEVEGVLAKEKSLADRELTLQKQTAALQKSLEYARIQQKVGKGDQYQLIQQELNLAGAQANLIHLQSERLANRVLLHQALGGRFPA